MDEQHGARIEAGKDTPIVRDTTFVRFVADKAVYYRVGSDVEVGFLQSGPALVSMTDHEDHETLNSQNVLTEVARMRIGFSDLLAFTMNFIRSGIAEGKLNGSGIQSSLTEWIEEANREVSGDVNE